MSFQLELGSKLFYLGLIVSLLVGILLFVGYTLERLSGGQLQVGLSLVAVAFFGLFTTTAVGMMIRDKEQDGSILAASTIILCLVAVLAAYLGRGAFKLGWSLYAVSLISLVQGGSYVFLLLRRRTFARLIRDRHLGGSVSELEGPFRAHSAAWFAIPIGVIAGVVIGAIARVPPADVVRITFFTVLALIAVIVSVFIIAGVITLSRDSTRTYERPEDGERVEVRIASIGRYKYLQVWLPPVVHGSEESTKRGVDAACIASDIRKVFVGNQYQQLFVLAVALLGMVQLADREVPMKWAVLGGIAAGLALVQLPYVIGQLRTHGRITDSLIGEDRAKAQERLNKYAPVIPTAGSWVAFVGSGTLGGLSFELFKNVIKGIAG